MIKIIDENMTHDEFMKKHGIKEISPGLGFSEQEKKYYGFSHRAIYGFGIGFVVKKGMCGANSIGVGFKCKTLDDCKMVAQKFADSVS
jgi:hypothetical protein